MTPLSTDDFPYTISYVSELLSLEEPQLLTLVQTLGFTPKKEEASGRILFTHQELDLIKKAAEFQRHGDSLETIGKRFSVESSEGAVKPGRSPIPGASLLTGLGDSSTNTASSSDERESGRSSSSVQQSQRSANSDRKSDYVQSKVMDTGNYASRNILMPSASSASADSITVMVEAVSQVKESILKDLAHLLDDKLAGLDEVVVELIRCKSENESLKKRLHEAVLARETMEQELGRFKPVQFGFYRKL